MPGSKNHGALNGGEQVPNGDASDEEGTKESPRTRTRISKRKLIDDTEKLVVEDLLTSITRDIKTKVVAGIVKDSLAGPLQNGLAGGQRTGPREAENLRTQNGHAGGNKRARSRSPSVSRSSSLHKLLGDSNMDHEHGSGSGEPSQPGAKKLPSFRKASGTKLETPIIYAATGRKRKRMIRLDYSGALPPGQALLDYEPPTGSKKKTKPKGVVLQFANGEPKNLSRQEAAPVDLMAQVRDVLENLDSDEEIDERVHTALAGMRSRKRARVRKQEIMDMWRTAMAVSKHEDLMGKEPVCTELEGFPDMDEGDEEDLSFAEEVLGNWVEAYKKSEPCPLSMFCLRQSANSGGGKNVSSLVSPLKQRLPAPKMLLPMSLVSKPGSALTFRGRLGQKVTTKFLRMSRQCTCPKKSRRLLRRRNRQTRRPRPKTRADPSGTTTEFWRAVWIPSSKQATRSPNRRTLSNSASSRRGRSDSSLANLPFMTGACLPWRRSKQTVRHSRTDRFVTSLTTTPFSRRHCHRVHWRDDSAKGRRPPRKVLRAHGNRQQLHVPNRRRVCG